MSNGPWTAGTPEWIVPTIIVGTLITFFVGIAYFKTSGDRWVRGLCLLLKLTAVLLLALCLIEPVQRTEHPRPKANLVPILVDTSQSMRVKSPGSSEARSDQIIASLDPDLAWRRRLAQDFDVRHYTFDARLNNATDPLELIFEGTASSLKTSLQTLAQRFQGRPVAGVLLFSDGNLTDEATSNWAEIGIPVYPVVARDRDTLMDLRFSNVTVSQSDFEAAPISVAARIAGDLDRKGKVSVQLIDAEDKVVTEQIIDAPNDEKDGDVHFRFRPEKSGVQFYRLRLTHQDDVVDWAKSTSTLEATVANNEHAFAVHRRHGPYRLLYLAGRPNWEFKFLRRALQEDAELDFVGLVRIAKKQPKFSFQDRSVSDTNPLFAGLGKAEEEAAQQQDEPVFVRLGVTNSDELREGFPTTPEELFSYHAIILDDIESSFFSEDQQLLLRRFVSARGGSVLFLGGQESFDANNDATTPLGELCPVYLKRDSSITAPQPIAFELTREGWLQPWLRLRTTETSEKERLESMPRFHTINRVGRAKPGASVLASTTQENEEIHPILVTQRFGSGRTMALTVGDLWLWGMHRREDQPYDLPQAWRQISRFLVSDVPQRVEIRPLETQDSTRPVSLEIVVRDDTFRPTEQVELALKITPPSGKSFSLTPQPVAERSGIFHAECWSRETGGYLAELIATAADGTEISRAEAGWTAQPAAAEFQNLQVNYALLESLAQQTGGRIIEPNEIDTFVADWPSDKIPVKDVSEKPLWHTPWVLCLVMACLCGEWGLRRWRGLP